jgi:hypothetical protein
LKHFVGIKKVEAEAMTRGAYNEYRGWDVPADENPADEGYLTKSAAGHIQWQPKDVFESEYLELDDPTKITQDTLNRFMDGAHVEVMDFSSFDPKTTMVQVTPKTGFVQYAHSSCVDPNNYDEKIGLNMCFTEINNRIWPMLGFVLQWATSGLTNKVQDKVPGEAE